MPMRTKKQFDTTHDNPTPSCSFNPVIGSFGMYTYVRWLAVDPLGGSHQVGNSTNGDTFQSPRPINSILVISVFSVSTNRSEASAPVSQRRRNQHGLQTDGTYVTSTQLWYVGNPSQRHQVNSRLLLLKQKTTRLHKST